MAYFKYAAAMLAALALCSCANIRSAPTTQSALMPFQNQPLTVITYRKTDFVAMTQTQAISTDLFGAVGAAAAGSIATDNGNTLVGDDAIPDPAESISANLAPLILGALKPSSVRPLSDVDATHTDEAALAKLAGNKGVIFEVQTINWGFMHMPFSARYKIAVTLRARLINASTGKRIAQAPCVYASEDDGAPTYDEMVADQGARLKAMLSAGTDVCSGSIQKLLVN